MVRFSPVLLFAAVLLGLPAPRTEAAPLLDQSHIADPGLYGAAVYQSSTLGQTFVPGRSGRLTSVDVQIGRLPTWDFSYGVSVDVRRVIGGRPGLDASDTLATVEIPPDTIPPWAFGAGEPLFTHVDLSAFAVNVKSGEPLAIVLRSHEPHYFGFYVWETRGFGTADGYLAGSLFSLHPDLAFDLDTDAGFRTYVSPVPTPPLSAVWAVSTCMWVLRRRWR
jgi:hypothetical protein